MCANGLYAGSSESGNFVIWDIEERRPSFMTPMKTVFQILIHTAETMVKKEKNILMFVFKMK